MTSKDAYIALNLVSGIGPAAIRQLVQRFGSPEKIFTADSAEIATVNGIGPKKAEAITDPTVQDKLAHELELMDQLGIEVVTKDDALYPSRLREVPDCPYVLYALGRLEVLKRVNDSSLAVVGTRMMSTYGEKMARQLSRSAAGAGWVIVSGLAKGIDTVAHQAALDCDGLTLAVTGCGLKHSYPPENQRLMDEIAERGCLLSEQPITMRPDRRTFPMRNRIVAGISESTLVVEAGTGSGSMITAERAMKYGRPVYAVPGRVDSPHSRGCHDLIRRGAKLTESLDDIQNTLTLLPGFDPVPTARATPEDVLLPKAEMTEDEATVAAELLAGEMDLDNLVTRTGIPVHRLLSLLMQMELKRLVRQLPGKVFELNN